MHTELLIAWVADLLLGDPSWLPHPVVGMGRWIAFWEHRLNRGRWRVAKGALLAMASVCAVYFLVRWLLSVDLWFVAAIKVLLIFCCLAGCTLRREVGMVFAALDRSLDEGRRQVGRIVGRDTQTLTAQEVRTAALETLAENLSDGVVAPLFWLCLLGVPGMVAYKMVNTLDSMIGYRTERYRQFGCWAARMDDVANFVPARLTAVLLVVVGWVYGKLLHEPERRRSWRELCAFVWRYGPQHASPNSGWPEAALAAVIDCQFGGTHNYFGQAVYKPHIGENARALSTADARVSLRLAFVVEVVAVCVAFLVMR